MEQFNAHTFRHAACMLIHHSYPNPSTCFRNRPRWMRQWEWSSIGSSRSLRMNVHPYGVSTFFRRFPSRPILSTVACSQSCECLYTHAEDVLAGCACNQQQLNNCLAVMTGEPFLPLAHQVRLCTVHSQPGTPSHLGPGVHQPVEAIPAARCSDKANRPSRRRR